MQPLKMTNPQEEYRRQGILTASPAELIAMLFDGLRKNLLLGKRAIEKKNAALAHEKLVKAQDIVTELINSLDMNYDMAGEMLEIYTFLLKEISEINISKDASRIPPVADIAETFRDTWKEISSGNAGTMQLSEE